VNADVRDALAALGVVALIVILLRPDSAGHDGVVAAGEALMTALI
jgi:hypothetical protein